MKTKYYLTEEQVRNLIKNIVEEKNTLLKEGWGDVLMGTALLLGSTFGGNTVKAQQAKDTLNSTEILKQIKSTLENQEGLDKLANYLRVTPEQLKSHVYKNVNKIEKDFNEAAKDDNIKLTLDVSDIKNQRTQTLSKIKQGYGVSDIKIYNDTILEKGDVVTAQIPIVLDYSNMDMFLTGGVKLSQNVISDIQTTLEGINMLNGEISNVIIEASTDKEPISIGNEQLAKNRANSVIEVLNSMGVTNIETNILPNQGPDLYKKGMSKDERVDAREQTKQYRYVKITFIVNIDKLVESEKEPVYEIRKRVEIELVKSGVSDLTNGKKRVKDGKPTKSNISCKQVKKKGQKNPTKCSFTQGKGNTWWEDL